MKKITDWTLEEVIKYCKNTECEECEFGDMDRVVFCAFKRDNPLYWDFQCERFTDEEKERAKAILIVYPEATTIAEADHCIRIFNKDKVLGYISIDLFPTLVPGEVIEIADIT